MINDSLIEFFRKYKKIFIFIGFLLILYFIYFIYFTFFTFHTTNISPKDNTMPTSYRSMVFTFNRPLKKSSQQKNLTISINPKLNKYNYFIRDNTLTIGFDEQFSEGDVFSLSIKNLMSTYGDYYNFKRDYLVQYVEQKDLPKDDLERLTKQSNSFENDYPLIKYLPLEKASYTVNYEYPDTEGGNEKMSIIVSANFSAATNSPSGAPTEADFNYYLERLKIAREEAIKEIERKGFNREKYELYVSEPYLLEEFEAKYIVDKQ